MNFFGIGQPAADVTIVLDDDPNRKYTRLRMEDGSTKNCALFYDGETVSGEVVVNLRKSNVVHTGIRIYFIGHIEGYYDRNNQVNFVEYSKELSKAGVLTRNMRYSFSFVNASKPYESYTGTNVRVRYYLHAAITRKYGDITSELDLAVHTFCSYPNNDQNIKMEVGIEDCLHIEFEYNRSNYHLGDAIIGKIYFILVRLKIKTMEIAIIKRETVGGVNPLQDYETIGTYEIMDGSPVRGETIPIRLFLKGFEQLTPTMRDIEGKFSVRYYINLVLIDEEDRRYFKQQEVLLWRKLDKSLRQPLSEQSTAQNEPKQLSDPADPDAPGPSGITQWKSQETAAAAQSTSMSAIGDEEELKEVAETADEETTELLSSD